jgi:hypothetical protein
MTTARMARPALGAQALDPRQLRSESGFALIGALLVMVLVTALGSAAIFLSQLDLMLAGNYRAQRTAEASADGALELVKGMIYGNTPQLNLPLSIPGTNAAALAWRAGPDVNGDGVGDGYAYVDQNIDVTVAIKYKQEDNINYNTGEIYPDEVVRYGKDYNYKSAQKAVGRQPVYTVTFSDSKTGVKGEADLISTIGFNTPAALFCGGKVHMQKYAWATEESIEVTSGSGTPAVATACPPPPFPPWDSARYEAAPCLNAQSVATALTIETVKESTVFAGTTKVASAVAAGATAITVLNTAIYNTTSFPASGQLLLGNSLVTYTGRTTTQFTGCSGVPAAAVGTFVNVASRSTYPSYSAVNPTSNNQYAVNPSYLHRRVFRPSEVEASKIGGLYNQARESVHILLGVGNRISDLDSAFAAAGGSSAGAAAADGLFKFYNATADGLSGGYDSPVAYAGTGTPAKPVCSGVVCYGYPMPKAQAPLTALETMFGQGFADLKSLADQEFTCTTPVTLPTGGSSSYGCNLSGVNLGSMTDPQVVYFNGTGTASPVALKTDAGTQVTGFGILIIDGDADIVGSINWRGLMLIKGNLQFRPWQGGTQSLRSGPDLATQWNGFIIVGKDLDLWTYWGGSIILGYSTSEVAAIKGIISSTVPHKVLSWRRMYN